MMREEAQRNELPGNPITAPNFWLDPEAQKPHPAESLFTIGDLKQLLMKGDVPEKMVGIISHLLWKAERYNIPALQSRIEWYLLGRLGKDREARREFMEVVMRYKEPSEEELEGTT